MQNRHSPRGDCREGGPSITRTDDDKEDVGEPCCRREPKIVGCQNRLYISISRAVRHRRLRDGDGGRLGRCRERPAPRALVVWLLLAACVAFVSKRRVAVVEETIKEGEKEHATRSLSHPKGDLNFHDAFRISKPWRASQNLHRDAHAFQPVHDSKIVAVHREIDGAVRKYLAYDCDPEGTEIRLYYTNNLNKKWVPYSGNPILARPRGEDFGPLSLHYRWPSTVWDGSTFHMFLADQTNRQLQRWTSQDGVAFRLAEEVPVAEGTIFMNPFCWKDPNDGLWYLYHKQHGDPRLLLVRSHPQIEGLALARDREVLRDTDLVRGTVAAPALFYHDGYYWLMTEGKEEEIWNVYALKSRFPDKDFVMSKDSPVLTQNEAVAIPLRSDQDERVYLFISRKPKKKKNIWIAQMREMEMK